MTNNLIFLQLLSQNVASDLDEEITSDAMSIAADDSSQ